ncbi:MAG: thioesterase family protein [Actinomycetota bacterium]|nr:thioesterase family protein [Actinomycetota bacterium]
MSESFYRVEDEHLLPSALTRGPWDPAAQHAGPPSALIARALESCEPRDGMQIGRVTIEILGPVPLEPLRVSAKVVRPGRSVELLEASLSGPDGDLMRARAWRLETGVSAETGGTPPAGPASGEHRAFFPTGQEVGYHTAMEYRFVHGAFLEPGPATVWMRARVPLVAGEEPTPLQRVMVAADSGNGVSAALDWREHLFINTDLSVHLLRLPESEWVCLDAQTVIGPLGMADTALFDERGRIGRAVQTLLVRPRSSTESKSA